MDNATQDDKEVSPAELPQLHQPNAPLKKGIGLILAAYALMIIYHYIVSKGLAIQPLARCGLAVVLGAFAFKSKRWATWILFLLAIAWILQSAMQATGENLQWHARGISIIHGIITGFGLFYLWKAIGLQKQEWQEKVFDKMDLQQVSRGLDSTTQSFLERMSHLFNAGFGRCQIMEVLELSRNLKEQGQKAFYFYPLHNMKRIPLKVVVQHDNFSPRIDFYTTQDLATKIHQMT